MEASSDMSDAKLTTASQDQQYRLCFPRDTFLRAIGAIYAAAFASIAQQIRGLYGEDGIEPVDVFLYRLQQRNARLQAASPLERILIYPTAVWLHEVLEWSPSFMMQVLALIGLTMSLVVTLKVKWHSTLSFALMWFCYLSIVQCGQTFMQFQWDSFLLEVGFLAIWVAPWWHSNQDIFEAPAAVVWTLRFLFFKFMFMSGAVKIQSRCPTWLGLTALEYHFATQPLPLPFAWYAHQFPPILLRLGVAATLLFEGPWTFFIMAPSLPLRQFSAALQVLLQIMIIFTGNYNFFNLLSVIMAMTVLDCRVPVSRTNPFDQRVGSMQCLIQTLDRKWHAFQQNLAVTRAILLATIACCWYTFKEVFVVGCKSSWHDETSWERFLDSCWIIFIPSVDDVQAWIARVLPSSISCSAIIIVVAAFWQLLTINCAPPSRHESSRWLKSTYILVSSVVAAWVFCSSALTFSILDRPFQHSMPPIVVQTYETTSHWRITNAYGLFRTMTGVGTVEYHGQHISVVARPEIILEGTDDGGATWKPYHFLYKPGDVHSAPRVNIPFQPRLDWQMWFAALGNYHSAPWIVNLINKLLRGSPDVKALLDLTRDPFPYHPPQAIRSQFYYYDFTRLNLTWHRTIPTAFLVNNTPEVAWWSRTLQSEYVPVIEQDNPTVAQFIHHHFGRDSNVPTQPLGCHPSVSSTSSYGRAWSCHTLRYLVEWPCISAILLMLMITNVAMSTCITQKPKFNKQ